jgi:hypothetical protein
MTTMNQDHPSSRDQQVLMLSKRLRVLTRQQIEQIDAALAELGPFSQVRLIKEKGKLRFIERLESESVVWNPADE